VVIAMAPLTRERAHLDFAEVSAKIGFWDHHELEGTLHWSHGMESLYGLPRGVFRGTVDEALQHIHPDDLARYLVERRQAVLDGRAFELRFRIVRADGAVRWVVSKGAVRCGTDGAYLGASGFQVDVTEEMEHKQLMRLQAQVMKNMAEGVVLVCTETGAILFANPRFEQMLGYAGGGLVGLPVSALNGASDQDPVAVDKAIVAQLKQHGRWSGEVKIRCADGREIWTHATVSELHCPGLGTIWVAVHSDVNERRLAQGARDEALAQLRRLSLNIQDAIEEERRAVSRDVHDQLGAALTGMRMKLEALARQVQVAGTVQAADLLAVAGIARGTQLAARAICTRLRPPILDDMGLVAACRWHLRDWSAQVGMGASGRFARLVQEPDDKAATDMFRIMQELLTNVARHAGATRVRLSLSGGPSGLKLRLQDDGHGFAPGQATGGFGLMGVQERLRHHDGQLHIASDARGTTVTVSMPCASPA
jgi:PAS domain S-box-containing protein